MSLLIKQFQVKGRRVTKTFTSEKTARRFYGKLVRQLEEAEQAGKVTLTFREKPGDPWTDLEESEFNNVQGTPQTFLSLHSGQFTSPFNGTISIQ